jgi:hypothetical protein
VSKEKPVSRWIRGPVDQLTGKPKTKIGGNKMSIELKQNLNELKVKLEHLRGYL